MPQKLTVVIPCKDESHNIRECIESVRGIADEILVADSLSTDNTVDIVREIGGCRIIQRQFINFASFKSWAIGHASHPWVLTIDADERLTDLLATEIREILAKDDAAFDGYKMRFETFFLGKPVRHSGWNTHASIRLFRRECRYDDLQVHERIDLPPERVGMLQGKFLHFTCTSFRRWIQKQNHYAFLWAENRYASGRRTNWLKVLFAPPLRFLHVFILRGGFLDGTAGLLACTSNACYMFFCQANLWERQHYPQGVADQKAAPQDDAATVRDNAA